MASKLHSRFVSILQERDPIVKNLVVVQAAQIRYLLCAAPFSDNTAKRYRILQNNSLAFSDPDHLNTLRSAVDIAAGLNNNSHNYNNHSQNRPYCDNSCYYHSNFRGNRGGRNNNRRQYSGWNNQQADVNFPLCRPQ